MVELPRYVSWKRRITTTVAWFVSAIGLLALAPAAVPVTLVADLAMRRRFSVTRTYLFFLSFFWIECGGLLGALAVWVARPIARWDEHRYQHLNRRLQYWWGRNLFWSAVRIFGVDVRIDGLELLEDPKPTLVLCRHASTLDTMLPIAVVREMKYYRYVIKAELLADPAMDFVAQRFPNCFVHRGSGDPEQEAANVVELGKNLEETGAVVVYPEGTRFTPKKRARLLEKFSNEGDPENLLPIVKRLQRTLPPLRQGARRLVETMTENDVLFIAHRGVDQAGAMSDLVKGRLTGVTFEATMWRVPAEEVPRDEDAVRDFLVDNWERVDAWACGEEFADSDIAAGRSAVEARTVQNAPQLDAR
jgi:hypothetical protein